MKDLRIPLGIKTLDIESQLIDSKGRIVITVTSTQTQTDCHKCGNPATKCYGYSSPIKIRHTSIFDTQVLLKIRPVRYQCEHCDDHPTTTEKYDWCAKGGKVTKGLEDYLMRCVINSTVEDVSKKERIGYRVLVSIMKSRIDKSVDWEQYSNIHTIGIDEISNCKGHQDFIAIVSTKDKYGSLTVIAVLDDRKQETVKAFFDLIPEHLRRTVKCVCTDMHDGFVYPAIEVFGKQAVIIDRYHVAKLYRKPLDDLRIKEMVRLKKELTVAEYSELEGMMWILRKQHECLTEAEKNKLALLYLHSPILKKAHSYALKLTQIFNTHSNRKSALSKIDRWVESVERSELTCFNRFIKTLKKYKGYIANYFKTRNTSGFVEGLNNKIKVIKRRCYGFFKTESLFQRLVLDLQGYKMFAF